MVESGAGAVQVWVELFRSLGTALLDVLRAEAEALGADFKRSGALLGRALVLLCGAAGVLFWTLGIVVLALIALLSIWLPVWAAALIVAALFAAVAGTLIYLAVRLLRQLESPVEEVRRRVADHLDWWQNRLLAEPPAIAAAPAGGGGLPPGGGTAPAGGRPHGGAGTAPGSSSGLPRGGGAGTGPGGGSRPPAGAAGAAGAPPRIHPDDPLEDDEL
jgi:uncharacterized membrane protein YgcG